MPAGWRSFFFAEESVAPLVLVRVAYGLLVTAWSLSLLPDATAFFSPSGVRPDAPQGGLAWSVFSLADSPAVVVAGVVLLALAGVALVAGLATRVAALVAFVLI